MKLIDEEKVNDIAVKYADVVWGENYVTECKNYHIDGVKYGVQFAETELSNFVIELIESIFDYENESKSRICEFDRTPQEVFEKFIKQRQKIKHYE